MTAANERIETVGFLLGDRLVEVAVRIWEPKEIKASLVCVHGFAATGIDFAPLAEVLVRSGIRVIAPDMFGHGHTTFLSDPRKYTIRTQLMALNVTRRYQAPANCYLGTSWGGLMALAYVAMLNWSTKGVILNDCAIKANAHVKDFRDRLIVDAGLSFPSRDEAAEYILSSRSLTFLTRPARERFLQSRIHEVQGEWRMNYDPALAETLRQNKPFSVEEMLINAPRPILLNFGNESPYADDPLNDAIAAQNPNITLIKSMAAGHPPSLMKPDQILTISGYLTQCLGSL